MSATVEQRSLFSSEVLRGAVGREALDQLRPRVIGCDDCLLSATRKQAVFGTGSCESPPICFVGEAPGAVEDEQGEPFVGRSGELLTKMVEAIGLSRDAVYICNVVCCRPPENRTPELQEIAACREHLTGQIRAVQPRCVVALGTTAAWTLVGKRDKTLSELRGRWHLGIAAVGGAPVRVTYHPAYLLRQEGKSKKYDAWKDLQAVMEFLASDHVVKGE